MLALKLMLMVAGALMLLGAAAIPLVGLWRRVQLARTKAAAEGTNEELEMKPEEIPWRRPAALAIAGCVPLLVAASIVVVPSGMGGVLVSQLRGTLPGTLYPGLHIVTPLVDSVQLFDLRDHVFTAGLVEQGGKKEPVPADLNVQSLEGLNIGLGVTVRYRLDPNKLASVQAHLPQPPDKELGASRSGQRVAGTDAEVHGERDFFNQTRRVAGQGCRHDHAQARWRRHHRGRGDAL